VVYVDLDGRFEVKRFRELAWFHLQRCLRAAGELPVSLLPDVEVDAFLRDTLSRLFVFRPMSYTEFHEVLSTLPQTLTSIEPPVTLLVFDAVNAFQNSYHVPPTLSNAYQSMFKSIQRLLTFIIKEFGLVAFGALRMRHGKDDATATDAQAMRPVWWKDLVVWCIHLEEGRTSVDGGTTFQGFLSHLGGSRRSFTMEMTNEGVFAPEEEVHGIEDS